MRFNSIAMSKKKYRSQFRKLIFFRKFIEGLVLPTVLLTLTIVSITEVQARTPHNILTHSEKAYLDSIGPVTMCIDPDWRPFEYLDEKKNYSGISAELIGLIAERTGINFKLIYTSDWNESLRYSTEGRCMILPFLTQTSARNNWLLFTTSYFKEPNVLITREDHEDIPNLSTLTTATIALPKGTSVEEKIRKAYPNLTILLFNNEEESIQAVSDRRANLTIRSMTMAAYVIKSQGLFNLKIAGNLPEFTNEFRIAVNKDYPLLKDILNKGISTLTEQDIRNAINKHISITIVDKTNYKPVIQFGAILLILITIGYVWNYQLRKLNQRLKQSREELIVISEQLQNDITQRKLIEVKLNERDKQLSNLISNLPGFVYRCLDDESFTMLYISNGCYKVTGYIPQEFIQNQKLRFTDIILESELSDIRTKWIMANEDKSHFEHAYRIRHADGSIRWVWERGYITYDESEKKNVLEGFISDITTQKITEAEVHNNEVMLREINAQKDKFFSIIAHDLRSPFTAIVGFSELLARRVEKKEYDGVEEYVQLILKSSKKTLDLLMNLLEWARSQTGKIAFNPEYMEVRQLIDETLYVMNNIAMHKSIAIHLDLAANVPVFADRQMLSTIIRNLISNAIKFTPEEGNITIKAFRTDNQTIISITDSGIGISSERINKLFRIDSNNSTLGTAEEEGTGLGLILCKEFVDKHGGTIQVESQPGAGSTFTVGLPLHL